MAIIIKKQSLFCDSCGNNYRIKFPIKLDRMLEVQKAFEVLHSDCEKTWEEPVLNLNSTLKIRMQYWLQNGQRGTSSETIFQTISGQDINASISHPYDPDDFGRCYKLLKIIPEWNGMLYLLRKVSSEWCYLVDNWEKLTKMYERNVDENWENADKIGMYEFMQELIN